MVDLRRVLLGVPAVVLVVMGTFAAMPALATCGGHEAIVTEAVRDCPRARALLGDDAHPARLGIACGSTETSGMSGQASWSLPYTGSRGRGTVSFDAERHGGAWMLHAAVLEVDGEEIDLLRCGGVARPGGGPGPRGGTLAQTNADAAVADFDGKVIRSTHDAIAEGARCTGTLRRERGAVKARVSVTCKGAAEEIPLYDGTGAFEMQVGDPTRRDDDRVEYDDKQARAEDETPGCRLSGAGGSGTLTIWDASPAYEIVVAL